MAQPLHILHLPFWFILGGSLCEDLELFNSFKISPRSSKSEFVCKSYARFSIEFLLFFFGFWTSEEFWTSDMSDVRNLSDVRNPLKLVSSPRSFGRKSDMSDVRNSTDVRNFSARMPQRSLGQLGYIYPSTNPVEG